MTYLDDGPSYQRSETYVEPTPVVATEPVVTATPVGHVVAATPVAPVAQAQVTRSATTRFAPDAIIAALVGLALLLMGLVAMTRAGLDNDLTQPIVRVLGFTHTARLGLIEIVLGACLLLGGATRSRATALFFGAVLGIAGFVGAVQTDSFRRSLALESGFAWLCVIAAVVVVISAIALPRVARRSTYVGPAA